MTEAEKRLWYRLRAHRFQGASFRRQSPIGPFIVDFVCQSARLIVEVDGGQHSDAAADNKRDAWLTAQGYRVLRFWNDEVLRQTDSVLQVIATTLAETSPPSRPPPLRADGRPPPQGGR
jgi:very-short-patch-repair endonuclease